MKEPSFKVIPQEKVVNILFHNTAFCAEPDESFEMRLLSISD